MRILLTRPEAAARSLEEKLAAGGHQVELAPVLSIEPIDFTVGTAGLGGILLTSASAAPALGKMATAGLGEDTAIYAIGSTSAEAVRRAGFGNVISGDGDRRVFAALIAAHHDPASGPLLHLSGRHRAGDLVGELQALGLEATGVRVYEAVAASRLSVRICDLIRAGKIAVVLFFSPRSAETFLSLVRDNGLGDALPGMTALCLSDAVAEAAGPGPWNNVIVAGALNEAAMIEALETVQVINGNGG